MQPGDVSIMNDLSKLYKDNNRFDDQIFILEKILNVDSNNEIAQSELAMAFESSGRDPLDVYRKRYEDNPENFSYGLDYADRLSRVDREVDAIPILKEVIRQDPSSKLAYRRLGEASRSIEDLSSAASSYEELFKIDPRDNRVAITISNIYLDENNFRQALKWADKSTSLDNSVGEGYGQKGKVFYYAWQNFRQNPFTIDDRIVAKLAYNYFLMAEKKGYRGFSKKDWLEENAKDILYGKAQWFMASDKIKRNRSISPISSDYSWISEPLKAEITWK